MACPSTLAAIIPHMRRRRALLHHSAAPGSIQTAQPWRRLSLGGCNSISAIPLRQLPQTDML